MTSKHTCVRFLSKDLFKKHSTVTPWFNFQLNEAFYYLFTCKFVTTMLMTRPIIYGRSNAQRLMKWIITRNILSLKCEILHFKIIC